MIFRRTEMRHDRVRFGFVQIFFRCGPAAFQRRRRRIVRRQFPRTVSFLFDQRLPIVVDQIDFEILFRQLFQRLNLFLTNIHQRRRTAEVLITEIDDEVEKISREMKNRRTFVEDENVRR